MSSRIVNWIYTAVVKPILLYVVALWWTALHKQCLLTPLNKVQRMAALCISGALRTTPNEELNAILNLPSLDLVRLERAKTAAIRLRDTGQWKAQFYGNARFLQHDKSIPKKTDLCKSIEYSHTLFEALIPDREEWEQCRPGTTDAICFMKSFRLPDQCSVFQPEVHAIKEALSNFKSLEVPRPSHITASKPPLRSREVAI